MPKMYIVKATNAPYAIATKDSNGKLCLTDTWQHMIQHFANMNAALVGIKQPTNLTLTGMMKNMQNKSDFFKL